MAQTTFCDRDAILSLDIILCDRDVILFLDNILCPLRRYMGRTSIRLPYKDSMKHNYVRVQRSLCKVKARQKHTPTGFTVKYQLTGVLKRVHAEQMKLANLVEWPASAPRNKSQDRAARYVAPSTSTTMMSADPSTESDNEDSENIPLVKLRECLQERKDSSM